MSELIPAVGEAIAQSMAQHQQQHKIKDRDPQLCQQDEVNLVIIKHNCMVKFSILFLSIFFVCQLNFNCNANRGAKESLDTGSKQSKDDCIPDSISAVNFAINEWEKKYGKKEINDKKPYEALLINDSLWVVSSSDKHIRNSKINAMSFGGVRSMKIRKSDCKILEESVTK